MCVPTHSASDTGCICSPGSWSPASIAAAISRWPRSRGRSVALRGSYSAPMRSSVTAASMKNSSHDGWPRRRNCWASTSCRSARSCAASATATQRTLPRAFAVAMASRPLAFVSVLVELGHLLLRLQLPLQAGASAVKQVGLAMYAGPQDHVLTSAVIAGSRSLTISQKPARRERLVCCSSSPPSMRLA